jgi:hypothetical protein
MTATAKTLREFLATLPDDTPIHVLAEQTGGHEIWTKFVPLVIPGEGDYGATDTLYVTGGRLELGNR